MAGDQRLYETGDGTAGFLKLPEGTFRSDPNGAMTQAASGAYSTTAVPVLPGAPFHRDRWWDGPANRWLPVPNQQIAPDGASYLYQLGPEVHLVNVATGVDRLIYRQPSGFPPASYVIPHLLAYRGGAVYLGVKNFFKGADESVQSVPADQVGVWQIDPGGAAPRRVLPNSVNGIVDAGSVFWAVENDNTSPPIGTLVRYDLASARKDSWFTDPGNGLDLLGLDREGKPIVWTYDYQGHVKVWRVSGPNVAEAIYSETYTGYISLYGGNNSEFGTLVTDSHGVWFGSANGLFLYGATGFHKIAETPGIPVGPCH